VSTLLSAAWPTRPRQLAALVACLLLLTLAAYGCVTLFGAPQTSTDLQSAGFQDVTVNASNGPGPAGVQVVVTYSRGPTGNNDRDAQRAEKIVWDRMPGRLATVAIIREPRECAGQVCSGFYPQVGSATRVQLAAEYGPRPHGLDNASPARHLALAGIATVLAAGLSVAVLAAAIALVIIIIRHRRPLTGLLD
jgi:hypothetical protein